MATVKNPGGRIVENVPDDHPCVALAKAKKDGWELVEEKPKPKKETHEEARTPPKRRTKKG